MLIYKHSELDKDLIQWNWNMRWYFADSYSNWYVNLAELYYLYYILLHITKYDVIFKSMINIFILILLLYCLGHMYWICVKSVFG